MGKNKSTDDGLTKAERKALAEREAAIMAELEARAHVKPKRKAKTAEPDLTTLKGKALRALIADKSNGKPLRKAAKAELNRRIDAGTAAPADDAPVPQPEAVTKPKRSPRQRIAEAAEKVMAQPGTKGAKVAAETALEAANEATDTETDEQIKARVQAKRAAREKAAKADPITTPKTSAKSKAAKAKDALEGETEVDYQWRKAGEKVEAEKAARVAADKADPATVENQTDDEAHATDGAKPKRARKPKAQVVEVVETENGREFAAGTGEDDAAQQGDEGVTPEVPTFAKPSEAPLADFEVNGNGQYKIKRLSDGKVVGYTRVTTYINTNEDTTLLDRWRQRVLLEGVAVNDTEGQADRDVRPDPVVAKVADLVHRRDVKIAKARKQDRKGKIGPGQLGVIVDGAWSEFKKAMNALAEELLDLGGAHEKAAKGTSLHALLELHDREGIEAVGALLESGEISPADLADVEAYARALDRAGIKVIPELIETPVVIEELGVAGRLDRVVMCKLPGNARAARYVLDVKSGRIDMGGGKIAQQLELYSRGETYDLDTHERGKHGASRTKALVLHLPAGSGDARIHVVDLGVGRVGNDLSGKVRAFRNDGKRAIAIDTDLAAVTS